MVEYQLSLVETGAADHEKDMERYRSGHNEAVLKTVCPKGRVGSNPTLSVYFLIKESNCPQNINEIGLRHNNLKCWTDKNQASGEVPKWLKGLPWKGSRSLVAARGFKSLLLRSVKKVLKK